MNKIKIVTDSTMDMPGEIVDLLGIVVVPLSVTIEGETYLDRVDLNPVDFIEKISGMAELPKSSQPSAGIFLEIYDQLGAEGFEVLSIHLAEKLSGTVRSAASAAKMSKTKVTVIDSEFVSKALAFQIKEAAEMAAAGWSMQEILNRLEKVRKSTNLYVLVDTLENLAKGGRIGKGKALIGSLLHIKPIAALKDGEYTPIAKVRSHSQAVKFLARQFSEDMKGKTIRGVGIAHAEAQELAARIKESIYELTGFNDIEIDYTNPIVSTHTGRGALALMYYFD